MKRIPVAIAVCLCGSFFGLTNIALSEPSAPRLSDIAQAHRRSSLMVRTGEAHFRAENYLTPAYVQRLGRIAAAGPQSARPPLPAALQQRQVTSAWKGDMFLYHEGRPSPSAPIPPVVVCDGKDTYHLLPLISRVTGKEKIYSTTKMRGVKGTYPGVLSFGYRLDWNPENPWIADLLRKGGFRLTGTEADRRFGTLYRVEGTFADRAVVFWLAPRYGDLAVRTQISPQDGKGYRSAYRVTKLRQAGGIWLAQRGVREMFLLPGNQLQTRYSIDVIDLKLNATPDSLFHPSLPPGTTLYDQDQNLMYLVGYGNDLVVDQGFEAWKRPSLHLALGWLFVGSLATLLMLGVSALVRRRGQRAAA